MADDITSIPSARSKFLTPSGEVDRVWYRFLLNLFNLTGSGTTSNTTDDLFLLATDVPPTQGLSSGGSQLDIPLPVDTSFLRGQIGDLQLGSAVFDVSVLQNQIEGLMLTPPAQPSMNVPGPAFRAYCNSSQAISSGGYTKVSFQAETFDTDNCFDSTTNYRFTPRVAGYYQVNTQVFTTGASGTSEVVLALYKNGSAYQFFCDSTSTTFVTQGSCLVYLDGITDYIEVFFYSSTASLNTVASATQTIFEGVMVRPR